MCTWLVAALQWQVGSSGDRVVVTWIMVRSRASSQHSNQCNHHTGHHFWSICFVSCKFYFDMSSPATTFAIYAVLQKPLINHCQLTFKRDRLCLKSHPHHFSLIKRIKLQTIKYKNEWQDNLHATLYFLFINGFKVVF